MRNIPKLRFKEFNDEWEENNILELCSMKARIGWQNLRKEEHLDRGEFYLVTGTDFYLERIKWETAKYVLEERYSQDKNIILKEGDILITKDGSIGKLAFVENIGNKKATLNNGIFRIRIEKLEQFPKYLFYTFLSDRFKNFLKQLTAGSTIVHLYQKDFEKYKVAYPNFKEQQKIANFLSSVDKKISIAEEKLNLFNEYKKGIMQKIFNQELRFKDENGNDYPEWEEKIFGEIAEFKVGKSFTEYLEENGSYIVMDMGSVSVSGNILDNKKTNKKRDILKKDTLIMVKDDIGKGYIICKTAYIPTDEKYVLGDHVFALNFKESNSLFMHHYINSDSTNLQLKKIVTGSAQLGVSSSNLKKQVFKVPSSLEEQQKIADFLSSIDTKIEKISGELENLKEFKKGLLQQMFV